MDWTQLIPPLAAYVQPTKSTLKELLANDTSLAANFHPLEGCSFEATLLTGMEALGIHLTAHDIRQILQEKLPVGVSFPDAFKATLLAGALRWCFHMPDTLTPQDLYALATMLVPLQALPNKNHLPENTHTLKANLKHHQTLSTLFPDQPVLRWRQTSGLPETPKAEKVPALTQEFLTWLCTKAKNLHPGRAAAEIAYGLCVLHPFETSPGPLALVLSTGWLMRHGFPGPLLTTLPKGTKENIFLLFFHGLERALSQIQQEKKKKRNKKTYQKIGFLAQETGETVPTLRHWTKSGILKAARISPAGYHLYTLQALEDVKRIQRLKAQRYTLTEIKKMLNKAS